MVLSGVGDALGYRGARWEYCTSGPQIHAELAELGGLAAISLEPPEWPVSDDTVLHLATAEGLATGDTPLTEGRGPWVGVTIVPQAGTEGGCPRYVPKGAGISAPWTVWLVSGSAAGCPLTALVPHSIPDSNRRIVGRSIEGGLVQLQVLRHFPPPFRGFQGGLGDVYPRFLWVGVTWALSVCPCLCFSSFMRPFLPHWVLEMGTFPPPTLGTWQGTPFSLWSTQEDFPFLHETCPASPPVLGGLWGSIPFPHIFGGDAVGVFLSPFSFGGCMGPLPRVI